MTPAELSVTAVESASTWEQRLHFFRRPTKDFVVLGVFGGLLDHPPTSTVGQTW
jgi:hypothetical protein